MRLNRIIFALLSVVSFSIYGQDENEKSTSFVDRLSVTPQFGKLYYIGDLQEEPLGSFFDGDENKLGYGFTLNYRLSDVLSISSGILNGKLRGSNDDIKTSGASSNTGDFGKGIEFRTDVLELTFPRIDLNLSRLIFKDKVNFFNKVSIGIFASQGIINFESNVYAQNQENVNLLYYKDRGRTGDTWEAVTSVGTTLSYILNDRFDIGLESSFKSVWNDKLDAWPTDGTSNDMISYTAVTFTYHLKPRNFVKRLGEKTEKVKKKDFIEEEVIENKLEELDEEEVVEEKEKVEEELPIVEEKIEVKEEIKEEIIDNKKVEKEEVKKAEKKEPKVEKTKQENNLDLYDGPGNFVSVAAFRDLKVAKIQAQKLVKNGEKPIVTKNRTGSWYIVAISRFDTLEEALPVMKQARNNGYSRAWVLVKPE